MKKLHIIVIITRIGLAILLYSAVSLAIARVERGDADSLIVVYSASVIIFLYSIYLGYRYKNVPSPILFSIIGFCFGLTSLIVVSYFWGNYSGFLGIEDLCRAISKSG